MPVPRIYIFPLGPLELCPLPQFEHPPLQVALDAPPYAFVYYIYGEGEGGGEDPREEGELEVLVGGRQGDPGLLGQDGEVGQGVRGGEEVVGGGQGDGVRHARFAREEGYCLSGVHFGWWVCFGECWVYFGCIWVYWCTSRLLFIEIYCCLLFNIYICDSIF